MSGNLTSRDSSSLGHGVDQPSPTLRRFFLARLRDLVALRSEHARQLPDGDPNLRLLDKAIYSIYCDCLDLGVGEEARAILRHEQVALPPDEGDGPPPQPN